MKKALGFAVALGLVAGMTSAAVADDMVTIKGDARLRGVYSTNTTDASDAAADKVQKMDQRYRLVADIKINDDVKVTTRIVLADNDFGNNNNLNEYVDRAHMTINMFGGSWLLGRQDASWGNKFLGWGTQVDRIKGVYKNGDLTYGGYLQKSSEGNNSFGDGDNDTLAAFLVGKAGDTKYGVLANYIYNDAATPSESGHVIDVFFNSKVGVGALMGELVYKGGDAADNAAGDAYFGGFVGGAVGLDAVTVKGLIAYYDGNMGDSSAARDCDNDFAPSLLIGTCQETAIIDFGGTTGSTDDSTYLVGVGVDFKVNDKLTVGALIGYLMASEEMGNGTEDGTLIEYDLTAKYALAQNATYSFGIAMGDVDKFSPADDSIIVIGNRIDVTW